MTESGGRIKFDFGKVHDYLRVIEKVDKRSVPMKPWPSKLEKAWDLVYADVYIEPQRKENPKYWSAIDRCRRGAIESEPIYPLLLSKRPLDFRLKQCDMYAGKGIDPFVDVPGHYEKKPTRFASKIEDRIRHSLLIKRTGVCKKSSIKGCRIFGKINNEIYSFAVSPNGKHISISNLANGKSDDLVIKKTPTVSDYYMIIWDYQKNGRFADATGRAIEAMINSHKARIDADPLFKASDFTFEEIAVGQRDNGTMACFFRLNIVSPGGSSTTKWAELITRGDVWRFGYIKVPEGLSSGNFVLERDGRLLIKNRASKNGFRLDKVEYESDYTYELRHSQS